MAPGVVGRQPGRVCVALARKLQEQFPEKRLRDPANETEIVIPLLWTADHLWPATGYYRTDRRADCWRWEGMARAVRPDGTTWNAGSVGGYTTMTDLCRPGDLTWHPGGEITHASDG